MNIWAILDKYGYPTAVLVVLIAALYRFGKWSVPLVINFLEKKDSRSEQMAKEFTEALKRRDEEFEKLGTSIREQLERTGDHISSRLDRIDDKLEPRKKR